MAKTIGSLNVKLTLSAARLSSGLRKAGRAVVDFTKSAIRKFAKFGAIVGGIFGGLSIAKFVFDVRKSFQELDKLAKTARIIDIATDSLQALRLIGELSGLAVEELDKSLLKMSKNLGDISFKTSEAKDALEALNIDFKDIINLKVEDQLALIADQWNKLTVVATKNAIAVGLFGRAGIKMVNVLRLGSKEIKKQIIEAKKLGAITTLQAAAVEASNDAWTKLRFGTTNFFNQVAAALSPFTKAMIEAVGSWLSSFSIGADGITKIMRTMVKGIGQLLDGLNFGVFTSGLDNIRISVLELSKLIPGLSLVEISGAGIDAAIDEIEDRINDQLNKAGGKKSFTDVALEGFDKILSESQAELQKLLQGGSGGGGLGGAGGSAFGRTGGAPRIQLKARNQLGSARGATTAQEQKKQTSVMEKVARLLQRIEGNGGFA